MLLWKTKMYKNTTTLNANPETPPSAFSSWLGVGGLRPCLFVNDHWRHYTVKENAFEIESLCLTETLMTKHMSSAINIIGSGFHLRRCNLSYNIFSSFSCFSHRLNARQSNAIVFLTIYGSGLWIEPAYTCNCLVYVLNQLGCAYGKLALTSFSLFRPFL